MVPRTQSEAETKLPLDPTTPGTCFPHLLPTDQKGEMNRSAQDRERTRTAGLDGPHGAGGVVQRRRRRVHVSWPGHFPHGTSQGILWAFYSATYNQAHHLPTLTSPTANKAPVSHITPTETMREPAKVQRALEVRVLFTLRLDSSPR